MHVLTIFFAVSFLSFLTGCGGNVEAPTSRGDAALDGAPDGDRPSDMCPSDCKHSPYHVFAPDGRCVWSCSMGTTPDKNAACYYLAECICQPGLHETGKDGFGRRTCS